MSITDKISGRLKQAAGDLTGNESLRKRGAREERKGEAREELERDRERARQKADEVARLERATRR